MQSIALKVGDLAKQTGVSPRTLHYYDEIGLLSPSQRTDAGYRLYGEAEIIRLQQIISLRQLGFPLERIRECLLKPNEFSPHHVLQLQLSQLKEQIALQQQLCNKLEAIASRLQTTETVSIEAFIQVIEVTMMIDKYYTQEQQAHLQERYEQLGEERIRQAEAEWQDVIGQARMLMESDADPASEAVQAVAQRWRSLIEEFTGGDAGIAQSLQTMYQQEGTEVASRGAIDAALSEYMGRAMQC